MDRECPELKPSTEALPASDRRDQVMRQLESMCRDLIQTVHRLHDQIYGDKNERMIGRLEERVYTMTDEIHRVQRSAYLDEGIQISISHTQDGLPIRVVKPRKVNLCGL